MLRFDWLVRDGASRRAASISVCREALASTARALSHAPTAFLFSLTSFTLALPPFCVCQHNVYFSRTTPITPKLTDIMPRRRRPPRPGALADLAPLRILTQICLLQMFYYMVAVILIIFTTFVAGKHPEPGMFFDWRNVRGDVTTGWTLGLCWMLDSLVT